MSTPGVDHRRLGLVVVTYGSPNLLRLNLAGMDVTTASIKVIVVDNFRSSEESAAIKDICAEYGWDLIPIPRNVGFGGAVNVGMRASMRSGCDLHLVLNPDASINTADIWDLASLFADDQMTIAGPRIVRPGGSTWSVGDYVDRRTGLTYPRAPGRPPSTWSLWVSGACFMTSSDMWISMNGMDERYFLYWEDVDLSERCRRSGGTLTVRTDLSAVHDPGGTQSGASGIKSARYYYYNCRNRLAFAVNHLEPNAIRRWIRFTPLATWRILRRGGRRAMMHHPGHVVAAVVGALHGVGGATVALLGPKRPRRSAALVSGSCQAERR